MDGLAPRSDEIFDLSRKRVLVTGASRGIGRAIAIGMGRYGADVFCVARDEGGLKATADEINALDRRADWFPADLTDEENVARAVDEMVERLGGVDIVVNNAGTEHYSPALETDTHQWDLVIQLNLRTPFLLCREAGRHLVAQGSGKVINVVSVLGKVGDRNLAAYVASKSGLIGLTRALALEWAPHGIQVNALGPGFIATEMTADSFRNPRSREWVENRTPMHRWGDVEEVVGAAVFLASSASDFMTGQVVFVDGGWLAQ